MATNIKRPFDLRRLIQRPWNLFCTIGFIYQVCAVSVVYFNYEVNNSISVESSAGSPLASSIEFPDYTVCFDTESLIDPKVIRTGSIDPFTNPIANLTIQQMLDNTPTSDNLIDTCISRIGLVDNSHHSTDSKYNSRALHRVQLYSKVNCYKLYNVTKGIFEEYTCYTIRLNSYDHSKYNLRPIVNSGKWSRLLYMFHLNVSSFEKISLIKPLIHPPQSFPYVTSAYSTWFVRRSHDYNYFNSIYGRKFGLDDSFPLYNSFKSSYNLYKIRRLKTPYESKCFNYTKFNLHGQEDCIQQCLLEQLTTNLHLVPFTSFIKTPMNLGQLTLSQLESGNSTKLLDLSDEICFSRCSHPSCFSQISITNGEAELYPSLRLIVFTPSSPDIVVTEEPTFPLLDYLIYLFSCFGSWFGLCWFTLNPVKLYDQVKTLHPKLHFRCLSPSIDSVKDDKSNKLVNQMTLNNYDYLRSNSTKRYSQFNSNYNSMIGFISREIDTIKSLTQGTIRRTRDETNRELSELKVDIKNVKKSLKQLRQIIFGKESPSEKINYQFNSSSPDLESTVVN